MINLLYYKLQHFAKYSGKSFSMQYDMQNSRYNKSSNKHIFSNNVLRLFSSVKRPEINLLLCSQQEPTLLMRHRFTRSHLFFSIRV